MVDLVSVNLTKVFDRVVALSGISFNISGRVVAIVGPNGSGKTTLLSIISGLRKPSSGRLLLDGMEPYNDRSSAIKRVAFHFAKPRFPLNMRVSSIIDLVGDLCRDREKFLSSVERLGIPRYFSRRLFELSSGEAQLLSLVISLSCHEDSIAVIDEPLAHLDVWRQSLLIDMIGSRGNVIFTTHVLEEAEVLADQAIILLNGRLVWAGGVDELFLDDMYELFVIRRCRGRVEELIRNNGGSVVADFGASLLVRGVDWSTIEKLYSGRLILGVRRAGIRRKIYGEKGQA